MSLILDALRKSEAERRRGQAPDLYAELPPVTRRPRGVVQPWWWLAGALVLGALLTLAVSQRSPAPPPSGTAPVTSTLDPQRNRAEDRPADWQDNASASSSDGRAAVVADAPLSGAREIAVAPVDIVIVPPSPQPPSAPAPVVPAPRETITAEPAAISPSATSPPLPTTTRAQPAPAPAPPTAPAVATPVTDANAPISLSDLSAAERQQLPPFKVSMHLWDSNPAQRFAIVDGARVGEGDRIGDAFVESISRDGLVLAWNGRRLRLGIR